MLSACLAAPADQGGNGALPTVSGDFGERPVLAFPDTEPSSELEVEVLQAGDGVTTEAGDLLVVHYLGQVWDGAIFDTSYDRGSPFAFALGSRRVIQGWDVGLAGRQVGSRVVLSIPPFLGYGSEGNPAAGIGGEDTLVFVVDILGAFEPTSAGSADAEPAAEAAGVGPDVGGDLGSQATVSVPAGTPEPDATRRTVLARSDGEPVVEGSVVVQYAATYWDNSQAESTWDLGAPTLEPIGLGTAFDQLIGVPVGSRVLIEVPGNEQVPAVALVVDIVAQVDAG